ncbi:pyroglutamyl-peptidase 1-like isoform X2 [Ornithodoros turicata]
MCVTQEQPTVLLTGFGLFRDYKNNSSKEVVSELSRMGIPGVRIVTAELPVEYEVVSKTVPELWEKHKPVLAVHCGMNANADALTLEKVANNGGYGSVDNVGACPQGGLCTVECASDLLLCTRLDVDAVCKRLQEDKLDVPVKVSQDAGRFLCEFIYFTSLKINQSTVFVHVPPLDEPFSIQQLARALGAIIRALLEQLGCKLMSAVV